MRTLTRILLASGGAALAGLAWLTPRVAAAQNDVTPHLPNVLLLVDTSGSMEYLITPSPVDGVTPLLPGDPLAPGSACALDGSTNQLNRWATLVSVLTGSFQPNAFGCETLQRTEAKFVQEYTLPGTPSPYDYQYYLPWNRIYAGGCTIGALQPMLANQDWTAWGSTPYDYHNNVGPCLSTPGNLPSNCCNMNGQNQDGLLDQFAGLVRFGLMTLDTFPDPSTGSLPGPGTIIDGPGAYKGMWSYFHNWQTATPPPNPPGGMVGDPNKPGSGVPDQCLTPRYMEVGARNPAAPPWEGPLVSFGDPASDYYLAQTNGQIQNELLSMRPYGASPIAGLLDDAEEFLFTDTTSAPGVVPTRDFGPYSDVYWKNGCRKTYVILLTDGEPNLDLRGPTGLCDTGTGKCPYRLPETILADMYNGGGTGNTPNQQVQTYVVGFAMSTPAGLPNGYTSCNQLNPLTDCAAPAASYKDCCELQKLAYAGSNNMQKAYFADNAAALKAVLSSILSSIVGTTTARTARVYAPAGAANAQGGAFIAAPALSYHFSASFNVSASASAGNIVQGGGANGIWSGNLKRERYVCSAAAVPTPQPIDATQGDDYALNVTTPDINHPRKFYTYIPPVDVSGKIHSDWTVRPNINIGSTIDGFGTYGPLGTDTGLLPAPAFITQLSTLPNPLAFGVKAAGLDTNCFGAFALTNAPGQCVTDLMNWELGIANTTLPATFGSPPSRDPTSAYCASLPNNQWSLLGAIYHSTPAVVGPPREFLRDDTYTTYSNLAAVAGEPIVLYTATTDGQLHAFKVSASVNTDGFTTNVAANNELWSFFPPAVLSHLLPNYNSGGANLLDGAPVIADVPAVTATPPLFERAPGNAPIWRRVLVAGGGQAGGFYYALDITDPLHPSFLWQLATDGIGQPMFGATTPTPAITIVTLDASYVGTSHTYMARTQVPVAILPGGTGTQAIPCGIMGNTGPGLYMSNADQFNPSNPNGTLFPLATFTGPPLRCWGATMDNSQGGHGQGNFNNGTSATGNSITIVRLDTGEVLAHFTGAGYYGAVGNGFQNDGGGMGTDFPATPSLPAPITGIPAVYPPDTGQTAQRVYVGDADGTLWRIDLSKPDPQNWAAGMARAWDGYIGSPSPLARPSSSPPCSRAIPSATWSSCSPPAIRPSSPRRPATTRCGRSPRRRWRSSPARTGSSPSLRAPTASPAPWRSSTRCSTSPPTSPCRATPAPTASPRSGPSTTAAPPRPTCLTWARRGSPSGAPRSRRTAPTARSSTAWPPPSSPPAEARRRPRIRTSARTPRSPAAAASTASCGRRARAAASTPRASPAAPCAARAG